MRRGGMAACVMGLVCVAQANGAGGPVEPGPVTALFKMFLRDSAELPMDVVRRR
jgi:hypothetical protein